MEINAVLAIVVVVSVLGIVLLGRKKKAGGPARRVENYVLSLEERNGFHFVQMKLLTADGGLSTYELEPTYSHVLSDELCTASALAIRNSHVPAK